METSAGRHETVSPLRNLHEKHRMPLDPKKAHGDRQRAPSPQHRESRAAAITRTLPYFSALIKKKHAYGFKEHDGPFEPGGRAAIGREHAPTFEQKGPAGAGHLGLTC